MPKFKNFAALEKHIKRKINSVLENEIAHDIKDIQAVVIEDVVYDAYTPTDYRRRKGKGGLSDKENNIVATLVQDCVLEVENKTSFYQDGETNNSGEGLAGLVEFGDGYNGHYYDYSRKDGNNVYKEPRPFIQETREIVKFGLADSISVGLNDRGIKTIRTK